MGFSPGGTGTGRQGCRVPDASVYGPVIQLAKVLHVSLDGLVFDEHERGPSDDLALQFEAVSGMPEEERRIIKALLDRMILKYQAKQITERG
ncbi:hypothetical protein LPW36_11075 [Jinshanibacter sp. LJY008]|uniref:Transcriptional regulator n=1 Tax=Limnobaculum eriocheiris TaxID=2897391 RepID=A0A9X1SPX9_9GAMM|nr:hypothetical protein [Limnobaculum eriocheiris]MCD1126532.1 hypothetical protein [Limnobaculum eriocheiris]